MTFGFYSEAYGLKEALSKDGINVYAVHEKSITGEGVNIAILSHGNVRDNHAAFERGSDSAVKLYDFTGAGLSRSGHDTHIAGILISKGSPSHPDEIGVCPGANVHSARITAKGTSPQILKNALDELILKKHCRVIVTGIQLSGNSVRADGDSPWTRLYDYYAETYDVIFAAASGNSTQKISIFGDTHNGITTTGLGRNQKGEYIQVGSISNSGPTVDNRKKPEVAAPTQGLFVPTSSGDDFWSTLDPNGWGLTSYAVPHTAGVAALLLEAAAKSKVEDDDRSEVIKAVIVNSTYTPLYDKKHMWTNHLTDLSAWHPDSGYGRLDALRAYETLMSGRIEKDKTATQNKGWAYGLIDGNTEHVYPIKAKKGQHLVITVTWHRKLKQISPSFYMDASEGFTLELKVLSPAGQMLIFETPARNNLIKTDDSLSEDGDYRIILKNPTQVSNRDYGLAFELIDNS